MRLSNVLACCTFLALACSSRGRSRDDAAVSSLIDDMALVPAGWFSMGCYRLLAADESIKRRDPAADDTQRLWDCVTNDPPRRVWLSSFEIDRFEVTNDDYEPCVIAGTCRELSRSGRAGKRERNLSAVVTFDDAVRYCEWRGKRLPTDAEWQKAARGTDDRIYPWGDERPTCRHLHEATLRRDGFEAYNLCPDRSHLIVGDEPVGMHPAGASPYGVQDLLETTEEWVSDWYAHVTLGPSVVAGFSFSRRQVGSSVILEFDWSSVKFPTKDASLVDPQGPPKPDASLPQLHATKGDIYGISGVDFGKPDAYNLQANRWYAGFRCARSVKGPAPPKVASPALGELAFPYREPGYTPPGTPPGEPAPMSGMPDGS